jgi:hypothetical protein
MSKIKKKAKFKLLNFLKSIYMYAYAIVMARCDENVWGQTHMDLHVLHQLSSQKEPPPPISISVFMKFTFAMAPTSVIFWFLIGHILKVTYTPPLHSIPAERDCRNSVPLFTETPSPSILVIQTNFRACSLSHSISWGIFIHLKESCFLWYNTMNSVKSQQMFPLNFSPPSSQ